MSKLDAGRIIRPQGAPDWVAELVDQLNGQKEELRIALRNLTFRENHVAALKEITVTGPTPTWIAPTLSGTWANFGSNYLPAGYQMIPGGRVRTRGLVKSGAAPPSVIFNFPSGYRPAASSWVYQIIVSNNAVGVIDIRNTGDLTLQVGSNVHASLEGIEFDADPANCAPPTPPTWTQTPPLIQHTLAQVVGVHLIGFRTLDASNQSTAGMGAPVLEFEKTGDRSIKLRTAWGLTPGKRYSLQLLLLGG